MKANFNIGEELYSDIFVKDVTENIVAFRLPKSEATIERVEALCDLKAGVSDMGEYLFITINRRHVDNFKILQL